MTTPTQSPDLPTPDRLSVSITQILASVLAAVSATVAASFFGVAGTVIGAALGSVISVVGGALYKHSIERTRDRLRTAAVESAVGHRFGLTDTALTPVRTGGPDQLAQADLGRRPVAGRRTPWFEPKRALLAVAALFAVTIAGVSAFEAVSGRPLAATVAGKSGSGTTLGGGTTAGAASRAPSSNPPATAGSASSRSVTASQPASGSRTGSAAASGGTGQSPTATASPSAAQSASQSSAAAPSGSAATPTDSANVASSSASVSP